MLQLDPSAPSNSRPNARSAAVAGTVAQKSDENLDEILVRVGTYFGRDPNVWTREGEQRTEVVEEGGKRVVKRMQKFVGWKLGLRLMLPLFDPRLTAVDGRPELDFSVESLEMTGALFAASLPPNLSRLRPLADHSPRPLRRPPTADVILVTASISPPCASFSCGSLHADNAIWGKVIADQPWTSQESRRRVCRLLEAKMLRYVLASSPFHATPIASPVR